MRLLLDTHILLWILAGTADEKIRETVSRARSVHVSLVSLWEIEIKQSLGRLQTQGDIYKSLEQSTAVILPITLSHIRRISALPLHHRDPFDRMLIVQAQVEGLGLLTRDKEMSYYDVPLL